MKATLSPAAIEQSLRLAFHTDVQALKPGNVHRHAAGHGMTVEDFECSAAACVPWLVRSELTAGQRLYEAVRATREAVGCNTNLGMLLLFVPLVLAVDRPRQGDLRQRLRSALRELDTPAEAERYFAAIRLAAPGGLGHSECHDVHAPATGGVIEAMCAAQHRDCIARQYAGDYADLFAEPLAVLREHLGRWHSVEWALVACYLSFLSRFADSHIVRKHGASAASDVQQQAEKILTTFIGAGNPEEAAPVLLEFDAHLKAEGMNPGTSADLAAACLLVQELGQLLE